MTSPSLLQRALLAIALMVGFYVLALGVAGGLLYIPYALIVYVERLDIRLMIICLGCAGAILWSVLPRRDLFVPPGPLLTSQEHPRLFEELRQVAEAVAQPLPKEVYLVPEMNAWVTNRGGVMGFGSRRVMGLGLPLLQLLTVTQLRAVLAHEFGHYCGGDTSLAPWVYKTRSAIARTLRQLSERGSLLVFLFEWYGNMFLRVTHAISRHQEFAADQLAARTVGPQPLIVGLIVIHRGALAFPDYWYGQVIPCLESGFLPPLAEGFSRFVQTKEVADEIAKHIEQELASGQTDPYDTHPPLRERIDAVKSLPPGKEPVNDQAAVSLLDDVQAMELRLILALLDTQGSPAQNLRQVNWEEVVPQVLLPSWEATVKDFAGLLEEITVDSLPAAVQNLSEIGRKIPDPPGFLLTKEQRLLRAAKLLGLALGFALSRSGWKLRGAPGELFLHSKTGKVDPFETVNRLLTGELSAEDWQQQCAQYGIIGLGLRAADARPQPN